MSSFATAKKINQPSYVSLKIDQERALEAAEAESAQNVSLEDNDDEPEHEEHDDEVSASAGDDIQGRDLANVEGEHELEQISQSLETSAEQHDAQEEITGHQDDEEEEDNSSKSSAPADDIEKEAASSSSQETQQHSEESAAIQEKSAVDSYETDNSNPEMPGVEVRLKQISQEVEQRTNEENRHIPSLTPDLDDIGHQSFLSLTDLIRTLRPNDKQIIPQIDSDYANAMRVLGEKSVAVNNNEE